MTATIQFTDTRSATLRDNSSKRPDQTDDGQGFQDALGKAGDDPTATGKATPAAMTAFVGNMTGGMTATTPPGASKTTPDKPALLSLLDQTSAAALSAKASGKNKTSASKTDSVGSLVTTPGATVSVTPLDPGLTAVNAGLLAMNVGASVGLTAQQAPTTPASAKSAGLSALGLSGTPSTPETSAADPKSLNITDQTTGVSDVKVATHILTSDAVVKIDTKISSTAKDDTSAFVIPATTTPTQGVTNVVTTALTTAASNAAAVPDVIQTQAAAPPRTMTLQLTPPDLGTVSVTMHLSGHALDLQLSVSNPDTMGTLTRDRDSLSKAVESQGYEVRTLTIQSSESRSASAGESGSNTRDSSGGQQQSGSDRPTSQSGNNPSGGDDRRGSQSQRISSDETPRASANSGAGALFV